MERLKKKKRGSSGMTLTKIYLQQGNPALTIREKISKGRSNHSAEAGMKRKENWL